MPGSVCLIVPSFAAPNASHKCYLSRDEATVLQPHNFGLGGVVGNQLVLFCPSMP